MKQNNEYETQANNFLKATNTTITLKRKGLNFPKWDTKKRHETYDVDIFNERGSLNITFYDSLKNTEEGIKPINYDILACLDSTIYESFDEFCDTFGYNNDSMSHNNIYMEVNRQAEKLNQMFTKEELNLLSEVQ